MSSNKSKKVKVKQSVKNGNKKKTVGIALGVTGGIVALGVAGFLVWWFVFRKKKNIEKKVIKPPSVQKTPPLTLPKLTTESKQVLQVQAKKGLGKWRARLVPDNGAQTASVYVDPYDNFHKRYLVTIDGNEFRKKIPSGVVGSFDVSQLQLFDLWNGQVIPTTSLTDNRLEAFYIYTETEIDWDKSKYSEFIDTKHKYDDGTHSLDATIIFESLADAPSPPLTVPAPSAPIPQSVSAQQPVAMSGKWRAKLLPDKNSMVVRVKANTNPVPKIYEVGIASDHFTKQGLSINSSDVSQLQLLDLWDGPITPTGKKERYNDTYDINADKKGIDWDKSKFSEFITYNPNDDYYYIMATVNFEPASDPSTPPKLPVAAHTAPQPNPKIPVVVHTAPQPNPKLPVAAHTGSPSKSVWTPPDPKYIVTSGSRKMYVYKYPKNSSSMSSEDVQNLFDGKRETKYYTDSYDALKKQGINAGIIIRYDEPIMLKKITLTTANDSPDRDPAGIQIFGSNSTEGVYDIKDWKLLYTNNDLQLNEARYTPNLILLPNSISSAYKVYKISVTNVRGGETSDGLQLAEINLQ